MKKIILISLLSFCLLCSPAMASYAGTSFEGHPFEDFQVSDFDPCGEGSILPVEMDYEGRTVLFFNCNVDPGIEVHHPFTSCGFSLKYSSSNPDWSSFRISLYNESGDITISSQELTDIISTDGWTNIWFYLDTEANVIRIYEDGVYQKQISCGVPTSSFSKLRLWNLGNSYNYYLDDLYFDEDEYIGTCSPVTAEDTTIYYSYSIFPVAGYDYYIQIEDEDGTILTTNDISNSAGVSSFPHSSYISTEGTYYIRLYAEDTVYPTHPIYFLESNYFEYDIPESASFSINNPEVSPGDDIKVYCFDCSGYTLEYDGPASDDYQKITISTDSSNIYFDVPADSPSGTGVIILRNPAGTKIEYGYIEVIGGIGADASVSFGASGYGNTDTLDIWYSGLPSGALIYLQGSLHGINDFEIYNSKTGEGIMYYTLTGQEINSVSVYISYDGEILDRDQADIAYGSDYVCYGSVYDAATGATIDGAAVNIGGMVSYADHGHYSVGSRSAGVNTYYVSADGYTPLSGNVTLATLATQKDFYMVSTSLTGGSGALYGVTSDISTGAALSSAYISITNGTASYQALGRTATGYYLFDGLPDNSTWTLSATKTGYDNYQTSVTIDGSTFQLIEMVPIGYGAPTQPTDPADSTSTTTTTDRPGRDAARSTMEEFEESMPAVLGLIPLVLFFKLIGEI